MRAIGELQEQWGKFRRPRLTCAARPTTFPITSPP